MLLTCKKKNVMAKPMPTNDMAMGIKKCCCLMAANEGDEETPRFIPGR